MNFVKLRVKVHRYIDRRLSVFHGPRVLARYCCNGNLLAKENKEINVVDDQIMTPTSTRFIAEVIINFILNKRKYGIYHITNDHMLSWFNFAELIFDILNMKPSLNPIKTSDLNLPAVRPRFSALNNLKLKNSGIKVPLLREELKLYLKEKGHL